MRQRLLEARRKDSGFTLIELLIVIVILGVLAAVVVLAVGAFNDRGEEAACKADVKAVEVAVEAYRAKNGSYPASLDELASPPDNYLRSVPNQTAGSGDYWVVYDPGTGAVTGFVAEDVACAGDASITAPTGPGGGGGEPAEEVPGPVSGLSVGSVTQTSASVSWSAPSSGGTPTGYTIQWATNPGFTGASQATDDASPYALTGLSAGTTYHVRVAATNGEGAGAWATTSFTTTAAPVAPSVPNGLSASNCSGTNSNRTCTVSWNASTGTPTPQYQWQVVRRGSGNSCNFTSGSTGYQTGTTSSLSVQLTGLNRNSNGYYCFRVRATNSAGTSNWSSTYQFQP